MSTDDVTRIEDKLIEISQDLAEVKFEVKKTNGSVAAVLREIGGVHPDGPRPGASLRERLHRIENQKAARDMVQTALESANQLKQAAREKDSRRLLAVLTAIFAGLTIIAQLIAPLVHGWIG